MNRFPVSFLINFIFHTNDLFYEYPHTPSVTYHSLETRKIISDLSDFAWRSYAYPAENGRMMLSRDGAVECARSG